MKDWWKTAYVALAAAGLLWQIWESGRCPVCGRSDRHSHTAGEVWQAKRNGTAYDPGRIIL